MTLNLRSTFDHRQRGEVQSSCLESIHTELSRSSITCNTGRFLTRHSVHSSQQFVRRPDTGRKRRTEDMTFGSSTSSLVRSASHGMACSKSTFGANFPSYRRSCTRSGDSPNPVGQVGSQMRTSLHCFSVGPFLRMESVNTWSMDKVGSSRHSARTKVESDLEQHLYHNQRRKDMCQSCS